MKRTLLTLMVLALSSIVLAQVRFPKGDKSALVRNPRQSAPAARLAPKRIQLADNQVLMGSYTSDEYVSSPDYAAGFPRYPGTLKIGQLIPADALASFKGCKIVQMRAAFSIAPGQVQLFIAPVSEKGEVMGNIFQQTIKSAKAGWNLVSLETPYDIDITGISGLLLGFSYKQVNTNDGRYYDDECYPLSIMSRGENYPVLLSGIGGSTEWYDYGDDNLSVQAVVEGYFPNVAARPLSFGNILVPFKDEVEQPVKIRNVGKKAIRSVAYTITANGQTSAERTVTLDNALSNFNGTTEIDVTFKSAATEGTERRIITITKVNGVPNGADIQSVAGLVASSSKKLTRRSVVEEYTGTGCGWCPRGIVGMENMKKKFGDKFIGIALHQYNGDDAMYLAPENYAQLPFTGAPSCMVDRVGDPDIDPYNQAPSAVQFMLTQPTKVEIDVEASWASATDYQNVKAKASVTSPIEGSSFDIEYVLVADGLSGNTSSWAQANYYSSKYAASTGLSKSAIDADLRSLWDQDASIYITFNDVAVASSYSDGINQAMPLENLSSTEPTTNTCMLTIPRKMVSAVKKGKAYVVALVIDNDGTIINAAKCEVTRPGTGIESLTGDSNAAAAEVFSIDGRRLRSAQKGINIIRMSDGSVRKILQK